MKVQNAKYANNVNVHEKLDKFAQTTNMNIN